MGNEVYRSEDGGRAWKKLHGDDIDVAGSKAPYSFNQIRTNPADPIADRRDERHDVRVA